MTEMETPDKRICVVMHATANKSLSPLIHNVGYRALGIDGQFVYEAYQVADEGDNLKLAIDRIRKEIRGASVGTPFKEKIIEFIDHLDGTAKEVGAVNTIVNNNGILTGYNTDRDGVLIPLADKLGSLKGKRIAVFGASGAARAAITAVTSQGAIVKVYNRTLERAEKVAREFNCDFGPLEDLDANEIAGMDVLINTTKVGMDDPDHPELIDMSPIPKGLITDKHIVFDAVYYPVETRLLREAREQGAQTIPGVDMLLHQAIPQFELYTGRKAPVEEMRQALVDHWSKK